MHGSQWSVADILMLRHQTGDSTARVGGQAFRGVFGGDLEAFGGTSRLPEIAASQVGQRRPTGCAFLRRPFYLELQAGREDANVVDDCKKLFARKIY